MFNGCCRLVRCTDMVQRGSFHTYRVLSSVQNCQFIPGDIRQEQREILVWNRSPAFPRYIMQKKNGIAWRLPHLPGFNPDLNSVTIRLMLLMMPLNLPNSKVLHTARVFRCTTGKVFTNEVQRGDSHTYHAELKQLVYSELVYRIQVLPAIRK